VFTKDTNNPFAVLLMNMLASFAEFELAMIRSRQREGIAKAKARGAYTGRKPAFTPEQAEAVRNRAAAGERKADLARELGVSPKNIDHFLRTPTADRAA
jgi:DNA invertase Pin-like site-specific DNA recombinase